jgi:acetylglutamate kinase
MKTQQEKLKRRRIGNIDIFIKDEIKNFNPLKVIEKAIELVPSHLSNYIDTIYVGKFDHMKKRSINASYSNGMIFVTNNQ